ncbi:MAG: T9SS type A sorting domain-containing protein [Calditrichaeota bacterium]|nr:T9SS type A sorting domain-containing protein [Calditrichota bacterium]
MKTRKLLFAVIILFSVFLLNSKIAAQHSLLQEEFASPDFSTPQHINNHVFNFFHHSSGANLLDDGLQSALTNLGYHLHSRINTTYEYENNNTDYRHWYKRFQRELGIKVGDHYYRYLGPDAEGNPLTGEQIDDDYRDFMLNYYEFNAERMDIIMFKPCYPGSEISDYDTQYDGSGENNGYGNVTGGTPHSDNGTNNFTYLNSGNSVDDVYTNDFWTHGYWDSPSSSLAQLKCAYRGMLNIFVDHPDILFIAMQGPPLVWLSDESANDCREFARWLREDWLHQYDPKGLDQFQDYPLKNVVPFDFHNSIAWTGNDANLDDEYFWFLEGGMPDNAMDNSDPEKIGRSASSEDHPDTWLNQRVATIFCGGTDTFSPSHTGHSAQNYYSWINAVVNRWEKTTSPVSVEFVSFAGIVRNNSVVLNWQTATESNNFGFEIQRESKTNQVFQKIAFLPANDFEKIYNYEDKNLTSGIYQYRLKQIDLDGSFQFSPSISVNVGVAKNFSIDGNFPNPFNSQTMINYSLAKNSKVKILVFDMLGRRVRTLVEDYEFAGAHQILWNGCDNFHRPVESGIYWLVLSVENGRKLTHKLIVLK